MQSTRKYTLRQDQCLREPEFKLIILNATLFFKENTNVIFHCHCFAYFSCISLFFHIMAIWTSPQRLVCTALQHYSISFGSGNQAMFRYPLVRYLNQSLIITQSSSLQSWALINGDGVAAQRACVCNCADTAVVIVHWGDLHKRTAKSNLIKLYICLSLANNSFIRS